MFVSWFLFPLLLLGICLGLGLLLEAILKNRLPGPLLLPMGFVVLLVVAALITARGETASLATPVTLLLALLGLALVFAGKAPRPRITLRAVDSWLAIAAAGVFLVYAAPVVLSGEPTFTGYIKLDDTATWLAFVDRVMDHGRDLSSLEPSTYQTTLEVNLSAGYPVGAFLPLGVGAQLLPSDVAWLVQPYMATMAALLTLCLYWLAGPLLESRALRALVAFGAAQSALLYAYGLWGGIKEIAVALVLATLASLAPAAAEGEDGWWSALPVALATTALLAMVGSGGLVWVAPILGLVAFALWRNRGMRAALVRALPFLVVVTVLAIPVLFAAGVFSPTQGGLTSDAELGNLIGPLNLAQYVGIWPNGDFRLDPVNEPLTGFLIALALLAAAAGSVLCWQRRAWTPLLYVVGVGVGSIAVFAYSSPWVGAKALASGSPSFLFLALVGAALVAVRFERVLGTTVLGLIVAGVLWSNALGYHDVNLAPYDQLRELEDIGEEFAGEGPALMTEYQPYGVRHFLRDADAEGASELRYHPVPLVGGGELEKGEWGDTDQITLSALLSYRTLVLRRSPAQSRPPSVYSLVRGGEYYDVWQQKPGAPAIAEHASLGSFEDPGAESCAEVRRVAALAGPSGEVAAAQRQPTVGASLTESSYPSSWTPTEPGSPDLVPRGPGEVGLQIAAPRSDSYDFYLQGSVRNRLSLFVDGVEVGSIKQQLNANKQFLYFGSHRLRAGLHEVVLSLGGQTLAPGSGGPPEPIGPLVISSTRNQDPPLIVVPALEASALCGRHLDWVEALP